MLFGLDRILLGKLNFPQIINLSNMHRRGKGGRGGRHRPFFNRPQEDSWESKMKRGKPHMAPPNLRGKQIGMYFANRYKQRQQTQDKKEMIMTFGIPESVENRVRTNLKGITDLARELQIPIAPIPNPFIIKCEKVDTFGSDGKPPLKGVDPFNIHWEPNIKKEDSDEKPNLNMSIDNLDDSHMFKKPFSEPVAGTSSTSDFIPLKTRNVPETPDFIPIQTEDPDQYETCEEIRAIHATGHYKYSYEDIITGTFEEKLDESLNKGVFINSVENTEEKNKQLFHEYKTMQERSGYQKMMEFRMTLPTYKKAAELLDTIQNNQVVVISGETGCGKSTQVPQLILDDAICKMRGSNTKIVVTQPRRIAASSLARRVAQERAEKMGNSVGYAVRLEKVEARSRGSIMYVTTGVLLADLETNQGLTDYSHIILDEVHERDCHIDLSMCMLRKVLNKRKDLKLILMSATLDAEKLSAYFDNCPMMHIEGLAYPVQDIYLEDILLMTGFELPPVQAVSRSQAWKKHRKNLRTQDMEDMERQTQHYYQVGEWVDRIIRKRPEYQHVRDILLDPRIDDLNINLIADLLEVISQGQDGAILVFLPGIGEITKLIKEMQTENRFPSTHFEIYPLHSKLPTLDQHKIFERPADGKRKIIIATNIAETSITIDDIVFVIDCAKIKMSGLNVEENYSTLKIEWVSQANLRQRRGRAGRCQPGICYHLLTSFRAKQLAERLLPELQRSDLLEPVLTIKRLRLGMASTAMEDMPSPPAEATVRWAIKHLQQVGALNESETLTPLGWHLARLPVHPSAGKLVLFGALFGCLDRAASVAAVWGFKDPFQLVIGKERETDEAKRNFALGEPSDHIAISEAIIQWELRSRENRNRFAYANFLSNNTLELLSDMKRQLGDSLKQMGFLPSGDVKASWENRNKNNLSLFKAIVAAALYPKIARVRWFGFNSKRFRQPRVKAYLTDQRGGVAIHPSSLMSAGRYPAASEIKICENPGANWLVYWLCQKSSELFLIEVSLVYTLPLLFFGELTVKDYVPTGNDEEDADMCMMSVSNVNIRCKKSTAICLFELRAMLDQVLAAKVMGSGNKSFQECVLNAVIELITAEDERAEYVEDDHSESDTSERD